MEQIQTLQEGRGLLKFVLLCFKTKLGLLTLPVSSLHIHKRQAPYPGLSRVLCDDMGGQGYWLCSSHCFPCLSMVSVGLFWLFLFVPVWSCQQFVAPSSPTPVNLLEHTPCSSFPYLGFLWSCTQMFELC